ncbi:hypothetical protein BLOT_002565 [Blomia tropicalis]|nr:hypothetical protein BLOT_002565 [Blomia tropicalis]
MKVKDDIKAGEERKTEKTRKRVNDDEDDKEMLPLTNLIISVSFILTAAKVSATFIGLYGYGLMSCIMYERSIPITLEHHYRTVSTPD